jgi:hypothetical protein
MKLPLVLHISKDGENLKSTVDSPKQGAKDITVDHTTFANNELIFEVKALSVSYKGTLKNGKIEGIFNRDRCLFLLLSKLLSGKKSKF